ncbi:NAD-dependent epimerase/dehydratase family protein [Marinomonas piezotolerans]|nr:NAD(P)-dependent oxidoreductase [Marinomonas piezotolerans]
MSTILITGHLGLVGRHLQPLLERQGYRVKGFDIADGSGDICQPDQLKKALTGVNGVIHLAAVSRVIWGEQNPELCWKTNALASEQLLKIACKQVDVKPWVLVTSSREVYGEAEFLPVLDTTPTNPVNVYGRAKMYMEKIALEFREYGLNTAVIRLANVYGCTKDHKDRVLPAFCCNAVKNANLRVDGRNHLFDFTHVSDTVKGLSLVVEQLENNERKLPPTHLLPGIGTTLGEAAEMAIKFAGSHSRIIEAPSRNYDVSRFIGDPTQAKELLGWQANISPEQGIQLLVKAFQKQLQEVPA